MTTVPGVREDGRVLVNVYLPPAMAVRLDAYVKYSASRGRTDAGRALILQALEEHERRRAEQAIKDSNSVLLAARASEAAETLARRERAKRGYKRKYTKRRTVPWSGGAEEMVRDQSERAGSEPAVPGPDTSASGPGAT